jgi:hypothetical protein
MAKPHGRMPRLKHYLEPRFQLDDIPHLQIVHSARVELRYVRADHPTDLDSVVNLETYVRSYTLRRLVDRFKDETARDSSHRH